jgi:hypothetical protein
MVLNVTATHFATQKDRRKLTTLVGNLHNDLFGLVGPRLPGLITPADKAPAPRQGAVLYCDTRRHKDYEGGYYR